MISLIVCTGRNNEIGKDNKMPWHIPSDLAHFKRKTLGKTVLMGRKTFESLGKPLINRRNVVLTQDSSYAAPGCEVITSIHSIVSQYIHSAEELCIIGGAQIYSLFLPYVDKMYITRVEENFDADTFFPVIDTSLWKEEIELGVRDTKNPYDFKFFTYTRT